MTCLLHWEVCCFIQEAAGMEQRKEQSGEREITGLGIKTHFSILAPRLTSKRLPPGGVLNACPFWHTILIQKLTYWVCTCKNCSFYNRNIQLTLNKCQEIHHSCPSSPMISNSPASYLMSLQSFLAHIV